MNLEKIVLVTKKTLLEELVQRHATTSQVKFFLESRGESYGYYQEAHQIYQQSLRLTKAALPTTIRAQVIDKEQLATFSFSEKDLIVVLGDPGLFVNTAKYVQKQPVLVVNPDQKRFDDTFTSCTPDQLNQLMQKTLKGEAAYEKMTLAEAKLEDGLTLYALNDFFVGKRTHVSARYEIQLGGKKERQSSSGIIISTGTGSTGWLTSVRVGAARIANAQEPELTEIAFPRDAEYLNFAVREPFPSKMTGTNIVYGKASSADPLKITSQMPEGGVIFSDGVEEDYLEFNAGKSVYIKPADRKVYRVLGD